MGISNDIKMSIDGMGYLFMLFSNQAIKEIIICGLKVL